ncbi:MAG: 2TM domain-containing protein [Cyanobacteria bacterium J06627_8]
MAERYSTEKVQKILVRAMEKREQDGFSRSQLEEMAADLDISSDALAWAEQNYQDVSVSTPAQPKKILNPKRRYFLQKLRIYAVVNGFLLALNFTISSTITWAIYPLLGWGMVLLLPDPFSPCAKREQT